MRPPLLEQVCREPAEEFRGAAESSADDKDTLKTFSSSRSELGEPLRESAAAALLSSVSVQTDGGRDPPSKGQA